MNADRLRAWLIAGVRWMRQDLREFIAFMRAGLRERSALMFRADAFALFATPPPHVSVRYDGARFDVLYGIGTVSPPRIGVVGA